jgi:outer membrane protein
MRIRARALVVASFLAGGPITAQEVPTSLSLEDALEIARTTNPSFLQMRNDEALADWDVRQAWGALMPSASATGGMSWQGSGDTQLSGSLNLSDLGFGDQPSFYGSSYFLGLNYSMNWATILGPKQSKAQRRVTLAGIGVAEANLVSGVTTAYVELLRQQDAVRLAELQLQNSEFNLRLARGQLEVGQVTPIDVGQAEIQVGRNEVSVLQTRNRLTTSRMRLLQLLGLPVDREFEATTTFELSEPTWDLQMLSALAIEDNPELKRRRLSARSADVSVSSAWSAYMPSMSITTGWSGFTRQASSTDLSISQAELTVASTISQCISTNDLYARLTPPLPSLDCAQFVFTDAMRQDIISGNNQFPFNFTGSPPSLRLSVSIPIFSGLSRQRNLEAARLQANDIREQIREQELTVQADLAIGLANVRTAYESALLEERNRVLAEQQVTLARERYQLGAITFVELVDAQTIFAQAEADRIGAVFAYHDSVTNLEALVGTSLRF